MSIVTDENSNIRLGCHRYMIGTEVDGHLRLFNTRLFINPSSSRFGYPCIKVYDLYNLYCRIGDPSVDVSLKSFSKYTKDNLDSLSDNIKPNTIIEMPMMSDFDVYSYKQYLNGEIDANRCIELLPKEPLLMLVVSEDLKEYIKEVKSFDTTKFYKNDYLGFSFCSTILYIIQELTGCNLEELLLKCGVTLLGPIRYYYEMYDCYKNRQLQIALKLCDKFSLLDSDKDLNVIDRLDLTRLICYESKCIKKFYLDNDCNDLFDLMISEFIKGVDI